MKRLSRCLCSALATVLAAAVLAAPISGMPASSAAGDPFAPGPVVLTEATHQASKTGEVAAANLGDQVVFRAGTPATGQELWITDGAPAGTRLLADIWPGAEGGYPRHFTSFGGRVFFAATDGARGFELWVTDGTTEGTRLFADLMPGDTDSGPTDLVVAGDRLYFSAMTSTLGRELWASDGTVAGTRMVTDIFPGINSSLPRTITAFGGKVAFSATVSSLGTGRVEKPFISDGTAAGTFRLDALPPTIDVQTLEIVALADRLLLATYAPGPGLELLSSAGAAGDARLVMDFNPGGDDSVGQLTRFGNRVVFRARTPTAGWEPWTSDGSPGGTQLLRDINPGAGAGLPVGYQVVGGRVWFSADDGVHGSELWSSDGTTGGTTLVHDAVAGAGGSFPTPLGVVGGRTLWTLTVPGTGAEPWVAEPDGRLVPLADLNPGPDGSDPDPLAVLGNTWIFASEGVAGVFAANLQPSAVRARPKRAYSAKRARAKRVAVKIVVAPGVSGGTVEILRKGRVVGRAVVQNGMAKVRIKKRLKPGKHRFRAVYRGSVWAQASTPDTFRVRVRKPRA